jgi:hypothetical protein
VYSSFSSIDDEVSAVEVEAAKQAAKEQEAAAASAAAAAAVASDKPWWPPTEFAALLGLAVAMAIAGISNALLCKPVQLNYRYVGYHLPAAGTCCTLPLLDAHSMQAAEIAVFEYPCTHHFVCGFCCSILHLTLCCPACRAACPAAISVSCGSAAAAAARQQCRRHTTSTLCGSRSCPCQLCRCRCGSS